MCAYTYIHIYKCTYIHIIYMHIYLYIYKPFERIKVSPFRGIDAGIVKDEDDGVKAVVNLR